MTVDQLTMDHSQETKGNESASHIPVMLNEVIEHLRPERKFENITALQQQIAADSQQARDNLAAFAAKSSGSNAI